MSVLISKNSRVVVQGFTGGEGTFHSKEMMKYGTNIVCGVTPGKGGQVHLEKPVFNSVSEAVEASNPNVAVIFVPPRFAKSAILESIKAEMDLIVCITEGIPVKDMIEIKYHLKASKSILIGPN